LDREPADQSSLNEPRLKMAEIRGSYVNAPRVAALAVGAHAVAQRHIGALDGNMEFESILQPPLGSHLGVGKRENLLGNHQAGFRGRVRGARCEQQQAPRDNGIHLTSEAHRLATIGPELVHSDTRIGASRYPGDPETYRRTIRRISLKLCKIDFRNPSEL